MMRALICLLLFSASLTSCYSYHVFPKEDRGFRYDGEKKVACVSNPELTNEYAILKQAGIYQLTSDNLASTSVCVRLYPVKKEFTCGNGIIGAAFFLGQLPCYFPDRYQFKFDEVKGDAVSTKTFELHVAQRVWFWDLFRFRKNFARHAGQALAANFARSK